jgi:LysM repeat protein
MFAVLFLAVLALLPAAWAQAGTATLPLSRWEALLDAADVAAMRPTPPVAVLQIDRSLEGSFQRGVFTGTLVTRVRVPGDRDGRTDELRIPILDSSASIARVELDGKTTSLLPVGDRYTVAVDSPGDHVVRVEFFVGREDDRFARRLQLALPPSGPTRLSIRVPEVEITADISQGAVTALRDEVGGTRIEGQLDGRGSLDLTWKGRLVGGAVPVKAEAHAFALFTLHEALVGGVVEVRTTVLEGETDRVALTLPEGVEIVDVEGDAVLQWRTEPGRLVVLLRYLVSDQATIKVRFQLPVDLDQPVTLRLPLPEAGVPTSGALGVQGPAGLEAAVQIAEGATALRDLPPELAALTPNPLLLGFTFAAVAPESPRVVIGVTRQAEVDLTTTQVDALEASTVILEDGAQVTRLQLHVRNETRQYLAARLPEGAVLTVARIDGRAFRPATSTDGTTLLLPLIQSERVEAGAVQTWHVRDGDTLSSIADRFYGDPSLWGELLNSNPDQLGSYADLAPGQVLRIPTTSAGRTPVNHFVIELAWTLSGAPLGLVGSRSLTLPELDADVAEATWHVYVPDAVLGLGFSGNLSPWSHLRYDHIRRLRQYLDLAFNVRDAWAGMDSQQGSYQNILSRRKSIYVAEKSQGGQGQEATGSFPLVGEKYRFQRALLGREVPQLAVRWVSRSLLPPLRFLALFAAAGLTLLWLSADGRVARLRVAGGFVLLLVVAWFVEGVHRRIFWGIDLALLFGVGRSMLPALRARLRQPPSWAQLLDAWTYGRVLRLGALALALLGLLLVPLLWSTLALVALSVRLRRTA